MNDEAELLAHASPFKSPTTRTTTTTTIVNVADDHDDSPTRVSEATSSFRARPNHLLPCAAMSFRLRSSFVLLLACGGEPSSPEPEPRADPEPTPTAMTESPTPTPERAPPADSEYGRIYQLRDDHELRVELQRALAAARERDGKLLVVFGAEWCPDCRQVAKLLTESPARDVVSEGYEVVHVNIGRRDRHRDLLDRYRVDRISTLVVLDGMARRVAQTTLEPISNRTGLTSEALATWLRDPRDPWRRPDRPDPLGSSPGPVESPPDDSPLFPPEILGGG